MQRDLFIVRGVQGAGKTTFVESLKRPEDTAVASDDFMLNEKGEYEFDWRRYPEVHKKSEEAVEEAMKRGVERIFLHNTSVKAEDLVPYMELAKMHGYRTFSIILENRHGGKSAHAVPDSTIEKKKKNFDISL